MSKDVKNNKRIEDRVSYLETCSYYKEVQDAVSKLVKFVSPRYMVELGCGNGNTAVRLAMENPMTSIVAMELVRERVDTGAISAKKKRIRNVAFVQGDFTDLSNLNLQNTELVMMVYSFAWITDPLKNKVDFLKGLYDHLAQGAYLLIADTFLLSKDGEKKKQLEQLFAIRKKEAKEVSFWNSIYGLDLDSLAKAEMVSNEAVKNEDAILGDASSRESRCFIDRRWLVSKAEAVGFDVVLSRDVNALNDGIVLLRK